jgi:predicted O-methyltransferase YrrM
VPIDSPTTPGTRGTGETFVRVDPVLLHAMSWAKELGVPAVSPGAGSTLRLLAAAARARSVVEIGTGTGVSGLWLLAGMRPDGVLTTIDVEPEHQAMARQSFAAAGHPPARARLIAGSALEVLGRLADAAYDLVFVDGDPLDHPACVGAAHRLLRAGGILAVNDAHVDPSAHDLESITVRELVAYLRDAPEWTATLVPVGTGLLCATKAG